VNDADLGVEESQHDMARPAENSSSGNTGAAAPKSRNSRASNRSRLERDLDRVSLVQALNDTEAATARVIDLTERLVDARKQISQLRGDLELLRIEHHQYQAEEEAMRNSMAFRMATRIWNIRNAFNL